MNKEQILAQIRALQDEWNGIKAKVKNEKREAMTAEETKRGGEIADKIVELRAQVETIEKMDKLEAEMNESRNKPPDIEPATEDEETGKVEKRRVEVGKDREASRPFRSLGEQLIAIYNADRDGPGRVVDKRLMTVHEEARAISGLSEKVPSEGGWLVQQDFAGAILKRVYEVGQVASRVERFPISPNSNGATMWAVDESSRATGSRWGGIQMYWVDEGGAATASKPKFRKIDLTLKKLIGLCYMTEEQLADTVFLSALVERAFQEETTWMVENAVIDGSGSGQPLGILNAAATVSISKETNQVAATIVFENIQKMWARMFAPSRANSVWFINQDCEPQLNSLSAVVGTGGVPVYLPPGGLSATPFASLMGRPVVPIEQCKTLGTVGDIILADLSQYLLIDKNAPQTAYSMHVAFTTDQQAFRITYRCNGQPFDSTAITPANGSNTLSPFITLATRA